MRLYEYEGKELFAELNIPVPKSEVVSSAEEALQAARRIGFPVVVKAQVQMGGRGKAGLIKKAENEEEAMSAAGEIMLRIGAEDKLLIEERIMAIDEGYLGITVDDVKGVPVLVITARGGMDVEKNTVTEPQDVAQVEIKPQKGLYYHHILGAVKKAGYRGSVVKELADLAQKVYGVFVENEADTVEINPVLFADGNRLIAGDAKVILDDYAEYRKKSIQRYRQKRTTPENNTKAIYVPLDGDIGIVSFGASNTMMLIDSIKCMGGNPANFSDMAGGASYESIYELTSHIIRQSAVKAKVVLINITIAGASLKMVIEAIVDAINALKPSIPLVANVRASGASKAEMDVCEAAAKLQEAGVLWRDTLEEAIDTVIKMSKERDS